MNRAQRRAQKKPKPTFGELKDSYVDRTVALVVAAMIRTLKMVYNWEDTQLYEFLESVGVLLEEVNDSRATVGEFVNGTKELTGIDVTNLLKRGKL